MPLRLRHAGPAVRLTPRTLGRFRPVGLQTMSSAETLPWPVISDYAVVSLRRGRAYLSAASFYTQGVKGHGLYDPHDAPQDSRWYPHTTAAVHLALCIESCKQINELQAVFVGNGRITPRRLTLLVTPLYNLVEHVLKLTGLLHDADRTMWREFDRESFKETTRALKKAKNGVLRTIRNKRSAHTDVDGLSSSAVPASTSRAILIPLAQAACQLLLCLQHEAVFGYYRLHDPAKPYEVEFFIQYPIASTFRVDDTGRPVELLSTHLEADPRQELGAVVRETIGFYNSLAKEASLPEVLLVPYDKPRGVPNKVRLL